MSWEVTGPDVAGVAQAETATRAVTGARWYCAYAALKNEDRSLWTWLNRGTQNSWAIINASGNQL